MLTNQGIQFLIDLGVDTDRSRTNINNAIKQLKNLEKVKVELDVGSTSTSPFTNIENQIKSLNTELDKIKVVFKEVFNTTEAVKLEQQIAKIGQSLNSLPRNVNLLQNGQFDSINRGLGDASNQVRAFNAQATEASRNTTSFISRLQNSFQSFPAYLVASTAIYGTVKAVGDLVDKVVELDTALVSLARVSDGEQYELDGVLDRAIDKATELSSVLPDVIELVTEFTRAGNDLEQAFDLANTAQILTNISDLTASQSVDALTAARISFNLAAEDSIRVADKLNEVN